MSQLMRPADQYRSIPPEPWGRRLARVRSDVAGLSLDAAAELAGNWMLTSSSTISRLETCPDVPSGPRGRGQRQLGYILCRVIYEVDPAEFGLSPDDVPPGLVERLETSATRGPVTDRETHGNPDNVVRYLVAA